jgi:hypothetical protein
LSQVFKIAQALSRDRVEPLFIRTHSNGVIPTQKLVSYAFAGSCAMPSVIAPSKN